MSSGTPLTLSRPPPRRRRLPITGKLEALQEQLVSQSIAAHKKREADSKVVDRHSKNYNFLTKIEELGGDGFFEVCAEKSVARDCMHKG